jgi:hypothetical protein
MEAQAGQRGEQTHAALMQQLMDTRPDTGQSVAPVYEGWEPNPDGTLSMYFGYMNRNWKETLDIPIGPGNFFEPGPQDRGQPTHFLPRRHKQTFKVIVPRSFGTQSLVWTLSIRGSTEKVPGSLKPELQIDATQDTQNSNKPPAIDVAVAGAATVGRPYKLVATVTDDGIPKSRASASDNPRAGLNVTWSKYRGPGPITFDTSVTAVRDRTAAVTAVFAAPGEYMIQALADDGSILATSQGQNVPGFACCWATTHIKVTVTAPVSGGK